jgi:hypothetical protein
MGVGGLAHPCRLIRVAEQEARATILDRIGPFAGGPGT